MKRTVQVGDIVRLNASTDQEVLVVEVDQGSREHEFSFVFTVIPFDAMQIEGAVIEAPEHSTYVLWPSYDSTGLEVITLLHIQWIAAVTFSKTDKTYTIKRQTA